MNLDYLSKFVKSKIEKHPSLKNDIMDLTPFDQAVKGKSKINKDLIRVSDILSV